MVFEHNQYIKNIPAILQFYIYFRVIIDTNRDKFPKINN